MLRSNKNKLNLFGIVLVAVIGGLLFGYDTAVISGAERGMEQFFSSSSHFEYTDFWHGFSTSSALIGCIIGAFLSGVLSANLGRKKSLFIAGILFFVSAWGSFAPESGILPKGEPTMTLLIVFNIYRIIGGIGVGVIAPVILDAVRRKKQKAFIERYNQSQLEALRKKRNSASVTITPVANPWEKSGGVSIGIKY